MNNYNENKKKNRSHRYDINKPTSRHGLTYAKYNKSFSIMILIRIKQHTPTLEVQFMKNLRNTEAELKKNVLLIKHKRVR